MTRNLKTLGLALLVVFALGAIGAQVASAADAHEFHFDGEKTILTGKNTGSFQFTVGAVGTFECTEATLESTAVGTNVNAGTWKVDELTSRPRTAGCTFGGQPAEVKFNMCDKRFDSDTTEGNPTGGKHANIKLECEAGHKIEIHTVNCTITIGAQELKHAVRYQNDPLSTSGINFITTAHSVVVGKERNTAAQPANGCLLFPTGAVGKLSGSLTYECRLDENPGTGSGTTPVGTQDATTTPCTVTDV